MNAKNFFLALILTWSCNTQKEWTFEEKINLPDIFPVGIALVNNELMVSDPDHNRISKIDKSGNVLEEWGGFQRPMHITGVNSILYVPEFLSDSLKVLESGKIRALDINACFDAPGAIDIDVNTLVVADFYNHRIVLSQDGQTTSIGTKGHEDGKLYYPTDVKLYDDKIFVADAYNNRVQIFDKLGRSVKIIGWKEEINVATGIEVFDDQVFVTDYHGNRILIYDLQGNLIKVFKDQFDGPTDILITENLMYITSYKGGYLTVYKKE